MTEIVSHRNESSLEANRLESSYLLDRPLDSSSYNAISSSFGSKHKRRSRRKIIIYMGLPVVLIVTVFTLLNTYLLASQGEDYLNQAVEVDIRHVELIGVTTKGLNVKARGLNCINYDAIDNSYFKNLLKLGGGIFQSVDLDLDSVELQTILDDKVVNVGRVDIANTIQVDIRNNKETEFDLILSIHPATTKILGLVKEFLLHPDKAFKLFGSTILNMKLGYLPIGGFRINFEQDIVGDQYFEFTRDSIDVKDLSFTETDNKYAIDFTINLPNPVKNKFFALHVPRLGWSLNLQDCDLNPTINLFDYPIFSDDFKISPLEDSINIKVSTAISQLDSKFQTKCSIDEDSDTPLSRIADQFMNNKTLPIILKNRQGPKGYPSFINELLSLIDFRFDYLSNIETNNLIHNVSIDHLNFEFQNGDTNKPVISGDINLYLSLPKGLKNISISYIRGSQTLFHFDIPFAKINLDKWHICENQFIEDESLLSISFKLDQEEVEIINKGEFGKVLNEILTSSSSKVSIDAILDCLINTLMGEFEIGKIHAKSESYLTRGMIFKGW